MHIETVNLPDGISELVPSSEDEPVESRLHLNDLNLIELNQDPDQCSEEPKANFAKEDNSRCMNPFIFARIYI